MRIYKEKFMEVAILIREYRLNPDRPECLKEAEQICRSMQGYGSKMSWSPEEEK
ncbi:MAG: hypothetical protein HY954_07595 [Deltaproteobacteria bacterium]|nr:hypothetical protein [Deltaproteobacteria bacterium]